MKKILQALLMISVCGGLLACATQNCRALKEREGVPAPPPRKEMDPMSKTSAADRVRVFKPDGTLQCSQGKQIPLSEMQKELKDIPVYSSFNKNDGLMRIQQCGTPTGNCNVYEIDRKNLEAALKAGFREWTAD